MLKLVTVDYESLDGIVALAVHRLACDCCGTNLVWNAASVMRTRRVI
jgi:hypothetical protein